MSASFFYDTWGFAALSNRRDPAHALAAELDRALEAGGFSAVTTDYVLDETVTLLHSSAGATISITFLELARERIAASDIRLVDVGKRWREAACEVFRRLAPTEPRFSFTDATSFAVMAGLGIELAFTADRHFHRAGSGIRPLIERRGKRLIAPSLPAIGPM